MFFLAFLLFCCSTHYKHIFFVRVLRGIYEFLSSTSLIFVKFRILGTPHRRVLRVATNKKVFLPSLLKSVTRPVLSNLFLETSVELFVNNISMNSKT